MVVYFKAQVIPHYALVDSGASRSMVPLKIARSVGLQFDETVEQEGLGVGGTFPFYEATNRLQIMTEAGPLTLERPMICAKPGFMLLGREDFFQWYRVTFDQRQPPHGVMEISLNMDAPIRRN